MSIFTLLLAEGETVVTEAAARVISNGNFYAFLGAALAVIIHVRVVLSGCIYVRMA